MTDQTTNKTDPASEAGQDIRSAAADTAQSARAMAEDAARSAQAEIQARADGAKSGVADEVSGIASALRTAAREMREGSPQERTFGQIAEGLADASESIRDKDLGEMAGDLSDFARRNPLVFLGGAALAGFAATRFAKASSSSRRDAQFTPGSSSDYARGSSYGGSAGYGTTGTTSPATPAGAVPSATSPAPSTPTGAASGTAGTSTTTGIPAAPRKGGL